MSFGAKHYVPVLKTKQGERWALSNLDTARRQFITPLIEIHAHETLPPTAQAAAICEALAAEWGTDAQLFLDTRWLHPEGGDPALIAGALASAREQSLAAIPVATVQYGQNSREQLSADLEEDSLGCMIRIRPVDLQEPDAILGLAASLGLELADADLLLDYRSAAPNLNFDINRIPDLLSWRTVTVASGSFPRSLGNHPLDEWFTLPRIEWQSWIQAFTTGGLKRMPSYGDYTTRDTGAPASGGKPSVNIRYTRDEDWLCRMGGRLEDGAAPQMKQFCTLLINHQSYSGQAFSAGDAQFYDKSLPGTGTGGAGDWAKWPISHHLAYAADQIAALPAV
jgi:hypothetical protein